MAEKHDLGAKIAPTFETTSWDGIDASSWPTTRHALGQLFDTGSILGVFDTGDGTMLVLHAPKSDVLAATRKLSFFGLRPIGEGNTADGIDFVFDHLL